MECEILICPKCKKEFVPLADTERAVNRNGIFSHCEVCKIKSDFGTIV